jgi:hypothetical protein
VAGGSSQFLLPLATLVELAVLERDERAARAALPEAVASIREKWEPETTARNLRLIREARADTAPVWATEIENVLLNRATRA